MGDLEHRPLLVDKEYRKLSRVRPLEAAYAAALGHNVEFMPSRLKIPPPYTIEFGDAGIRGYSLIIDTNVD